MLHLLAAVAAGLGSVVVAAEVGAETLPAAPAVGVAAEPVVEGAEVVFAERFAHSYPDVDCIGAAVAVDGVAARFPDTFS